MVAVPHVTRGVLLAPPPFPALSASDLSSETLEDGACTVQHPVCPSLGSAQEG